VVLLKLAVLFDSLLQVVFILRRYVADQLVDSNYFILALGQFFNQHFGSFLESLGRILRSEGYLAHVAARVKLVEELNGTLAKEHDLILISFLFQPA